jgi:hypothetical protein
MCFDYYIAMYMARPAAGDLQTCIFPGQTLGMDLPINHDVQQKVHILYN